MYRKRQTWRAPKPTLYAFLKAIERPLRAGWVARDEEDARLEEEGVADEDRPDEPMFDLLEIRLHSGRNIPLYGIFHHAFLIDDFFAVDKDHEEIELVKEEGNIDMIVGAKTSQIIEVDDYQRLPFNDDDFAIVVVIYPPAELPLAEISRVLRPGGWCFIFVNTPAREPHQASWSLQELLAWAHAEGLEPLPKTFDYRLVADERWPNGFRGKLALGFHKLPR